MEANETNETLEKIIKGLRLSLRKLIEEKKLKKEPLVIMRGDEIVWVTAEEMEAELDARENQEKK